MSAFGVSASRLRHSDKLAFPQRVTLAPAFVQWNSEVPKDVLGQIGNIDTNNGDESRPQSSTEFQLVSSEDPEDNTNKLRKLIEDLQNYMPPQVRAHVMSRDPDAQLCVYRIGKGDTAWRFMIASCISAIAGVGADVLFCGNLDNNNVVVAVLAPPMPGAEDADDTKNVEVGATLAATAVKFSALGVLHLNLIGSSRYSNYRGERLVFEHRPRDCSLVPVPPYVVGSMDGSQELELLMLASVVAKLFEGNTSSDVETKRGAFVKDNYTLVQKFVSLAMMPTDDSYMQKCLFEMYKDSDYWVDPLPSNDEATQINDDLKRQLDKLRELYEVANLKITQLKQECKNVSTPSSPQPPAAPPPAPPPSAAPAPAAPAPAAPAPAASPPAAPPPAAPPLAAPPSAAPAPAAPAPAAPAPAASPPAAPPPAAPPLAAPPLAAFLRWGAALPTALHRRLLQER